MATKEDVVWKLERPFLVLIAFITDEGYKKKHAATPTQSSCFFSGEI
jgi:hypothetical protein